MPGTTKMCIRDSFDADPDESLGTDLLAFDELREGVDLFAGVALSLIHI